jgi:hypothetical protein
VSAEWKVVQHRLQTRAVHVSQWCVVWEPQQVHVPRVPTLYVWALARCESLILFATGSWSHMFGCSALRVAISAANSTVKALSDSKSEGRDR